MDRLQQFIDKNGLKAKIIEFETPTLTVDQAVKALNCQPEDIVKSIIVTTDTGKFYLTLLPGDRNIKAKKLKRLLGVKDLWLASPDQVERASGYKIGGVPPVNVDLPVIIDERVLTRKQVYGGGGASNQLLYISVQEILNHTDSQTADISKAIRAKK
ncbi:MAG: aminoacyl-tRNA deacylase [Candidatus Hermodarchaeota archaeon]